MSVKMHRGLMGVIATAGIAGMSWGLAPATAATVLVDFGGATITTADALGRTWNNLIITNDKPGNDVTQSPHALTDTASQSSGWSLSISNPFGVTDPIGFQDANTNGTDAPTGDAAARGYHETATRDSGYGSNVSNEGKGTWQGAAVEGITLTLNGLSQSQTYDLFFFASRTNSSDNRETLYSVTGSTTASTTLNVANNTGTVASVLGISPDANNQIVINLSKGPNNNNEYGFYYLGVLEIVGSPIPEPASLSLLGLGGLAMLRRRRGA